MGRRESRFQLNFNVAEQSQSTTTGNNNNNNGGSGGIKGRAKEIAALKKLYYDCAVNSKVVLIEGKAGVGKTTLITSRQDLFTSSGGHFVSGSFDHQRKAEPFSALGDALEELFDELLLADYQQQKQQNANKKGSVVKEVIDQFKAESKNDAGMRAVLQNAFPKFSELIEAAKNDGKTTNNKGPSSSPLDLLSSSHHGKNSNKNNNKKSQQQRPSRPARNSSGGFKKGWNFEKLKISLRLLLRCICKPRRRVVLFLDDLHYADPSSLEMIEFLASGDGLSTVPIGGSRSDEVAEATNNRVQGLLLFLGFRNEKNSQHSISIDHPFRQRLKELKLMKCPIHRIHVKDLTVQATNDLVASILGYAQKPQTTIPLAQIVYKKTAGNPDSVLQMLEFLEHEGLIFYSLNEYRWEWKDIRTIHSATDLSDNIVDIVAIKLQKLPPATQEILKLGSCLGNYFRLEVVASYFRRYNAQYHKIDFAQASGSAKIVRDVALKPLGQISEDDEEDDDDESDHDGDGALPVDSNGTTFCDSSNRESGDSRSTLMEQMIELLQLPLKQDMLTKRRKSTTYFFAHDRLQHAAYALLPNDESRKEIHWRLGKLMKEKSQQFPDEHWMAYLATDQLNRGLIFLHDTSERLELATMNLQIALMSQEKSAFYPAAEFLRSAIRLIFEENVQDPLPRGGHTSEDPPAAPASLYVCNPDHHRKVWKDHYDLCLDLFSSLAEMEYLLGHHAASKQAVKELLRNARNEEDKFRAQIILIEGISAQRDFDTAIDTILNILGSAYDMKLSPSPMKLQIMAEKNRVNKMLDSHKHQDQTGVEEEDLNNSSFSSMSSFATFNSSFGNLSSATAKAGLSPKPKSRFPRPKGILRAKSADSGHPSLPNNEGRFRRANTGKKSAKDFHQKQERAMLALPKMTDDKCIRTSKLLSQLMTNAILSGKSDLSAYVGLRSIRFAFQHGISPHSPMALAAYGVSQAKEGKYNAAYANGDLALKLLDMTDSKEWYTRTILKCYNLRHIKKPFHESLDPMMEGYRTGVESGDLEYALLAAMHYSLLYMFVGLPLAPLEADLLSFAEQVHRYHLPYVLELTFYIHREYVLDLQGVEHDKISLDDCDESTSVFDGGSSVGGRSSDVGALDKRSRPLIKREMCLMHLNTAFLFGRLEEAEAIIEELAALPKFDYSVLRTVHRDSIIGLVNFGLAKATGKKKYRDKGRKIIEEFEGYVRNGSVNSHHILKVLQAEDKMIGASSADWKKSADTYDQAIKSAGRSGLTNHEAIANELAGRYMMSAQKERPHDNGITDHGKRYISRAMALYREWGAKAKVEQLEAEFPMFQPSNIMQGSNIKARRRFSKTLTARFRDMKLHSGRWSVGASSDLKILDGFDELKE